MTLTELRYLVNLARERHFGRAAEASFVSQPTLSVAIRKLEDELGVKLFERATHEVSVTPIGEQVVAQAQRVLEEAQRVKEVATQGRDPLVGPLRLGAIYTVGPYLLPALIPQLRKLAPRMPLALHENYTHELAARLRGGDLDAIVLSLPFAEPGVATLALYDEPFRVVVPSTHAWARLPRVPPEQLAAENTLLLGAGNCFRDQVLQVAPGLNRSAATGMQKTLEGSSLETIRHMVASGAGITVLPATAAASSAAESRLLAVKPFAGPQPSRRIALAWRLSYPRTAAIEAVRQAILACPLEGVTKLPAPRAA
jgi:LysR family hydrogen peroxide-inducible transcriptional activator